MCETDETLNNKINPRNTIKHHGCNNYDIVNRPNQKTNPEHRNCQDIYRPVFLGVGKPKY